METIERKEREGERIVKRIQNLKRQLYSMREYETQSSTGLMSKQETALAYYKQQLEARIKKNDMLIQEQHIRKQDRLDKFDREIALLNSKLKLYEERIETEIKEVESKKTSLESDTEHKIESIENDASLSMYMKEISTRDARLMAGRPKTRAEIDKEQEILQLEEAYKQGQRSIKDTHDAIDEGLRWVRQQDDDFAKRKEREDAIQKRDEEYRNWCALAIAAKMEGKPTLYHPIHNPKPTLEKPKESPLAPAPQPAPMNEIVIVKKKKYVKQSVSESDDENSSGNSTTLSEFKRMRNTEHEEAMRSAKEWEAKFETLRRADKESLEAEQTAIDEQEAEKKRNKAKYAEVDRFIDTMKYDARYGRDSPLVKRLQKELNKYTPNDFETAGGVPPSVQSAMDAFVV